MEATPQLQWFEAFGIELEYMIVDRATLDVKPLADRLLRQLGGRDCMEVERGAVAWSNELARHVVEVKTNGPRPDLERAARDFDEAVREVNQHLKRMNARLMPSGMHPWMDPEHEFCLWPVDEEGIYATFDRIFDCRGHGWSNLQSMHINLPFADDAQLQALHAAVRFLLPLLPALAASTPFVEGRRAAHMDERLAVYRHNAAKVWQVSGSVIPECVASRADYEERVLEPIYRALAPYDPEGILRHEWVNARGCIARFDRMALEIRVLDTQESPRADLGIAFVTSELLRRHALARTFVHADAQFPPDRLAKVLWAVVHRGERALIEDAEYLKLWGIDAPAGVLAGEVWKRLLSAFSVSLRGPLWDEAWFNVVHGPLARRLLLAVGNQPTRERLREVYGELCECLNESRRFLP